MLGITLDTSLDDLQLGDEADTIIRLDKTTTIFASIEALLTVVEPSVEEGNGELISQEMSAERGTGIEQVPTTRTIPRDRHGIGMYRLYASLGIKCLVEPEIEGSRLAAVMPRSIKLPCSGVDPGD